MNNKSLFKKTIALTLVFSLFLSVFQSFSFAISLNEAQQNKQQITSKKFEITFTNQDFLKATESAYKKGLITKEDYNKIISQLNLNSRLGIKGETKIVALGNNNYDIYLNNVISALLVGASIGTITYILSEIPIIVALLKAFKIEAAILAGAISSAVATISNVDNGIIIHSKFIYIYPDNFLFLVLGIDEQSKN